MICPLCRQRKARRSCPALARDICAVCCGTKRLTEIRCPADCVYLRSARAHPPAAVRRQQERDFRFFLPIVQRLTEDQYRLLSAVLTLVRRHRPAAVPSLRDEDVTAACAALAATAETADRGIIYEHQAATLPGQRLAAELKTALDQVTRDAPSSVGRDVAAALRALERCARDADGALGGGSTAFLEFLDRLAALQGSEAELPEGTGRGDEEPPPQKLIIP